MVKELKKLVIQRLVIVWLGLSLVFGIGIYLYQKNQIENTVLKLALDEISVINNSLFRAAFSGDIEALSKLHSKVDELIAGHFTLIDIYNSDQYHFIAAVREEDSKVQDVLDKKHHGFPLNSQTHYEHFYINEHWFLQVLLPVYDKQVLLGYFEAVYKVSDDIQAKIWSQVYQIQLLIFAVITLTSLIFYPIIVQLNRRLVNFSNDLVKANLDLLKVLGGAISARDADTNSHNYRVTLYAVYLAEKIGLSADKIRDLISGAFLHDVGKIGIRDAVLQKPGSLTNEEMQHIRQHVGMGLDIVDHAPWLEGAKRVIQYHHERFDGKGYQQQLSGEQIPIEARIFAIVDVFDALTSMRPYKEAWDLNAVLQTLKDESGKHFDSTILDQFLANAENWYASIFDANDKVLEALLREKVERYFFVTSN